MGIGAIAGIVGAVGSLASAGTGIAGSLMQKGPNTGEEAARINEAANRFILPFTGINNQFWDLNIPNMAGQSINFGLANAPQINQANLGQLQQMLSQVLPYYQQNLNQMQANTTSLLGGNVPTDVQQQIQRSAAFTSLMGGTAGAGTGMTGAITARDLGLTSLQLQNQGFTQGSNLLQLARSYLMPQPVNPLSLLPLSDLIQGTEWQKEANFQANLAAFTAKSDAAAAGVGAPPPSPLAGIGGALGGLGGSQSFQSSLGKLFGGGGGGNLLNTSQDPDPDIPYLNAALTGSF